MPGSVGRPVSPWWLFLVVSAAWLGAVTLFAVGSPVPALLVLAGAAIHLRQRIRAMRRYRSGRRRSRSASAARSRPGRAVPGPVVRFYAGGPARRTDGVVVTGPYAGRSLRSLPLDAKLAVAAAIDPADVSALERMTALLDELHPGWSDEPEPEPDPAAPGPADPRVITLEAARRLLGVDAHATADEICAAHRRLVRRVHPDVGGSAALTAEVNAAKDLLLSVA